MYIKIFCLMPIFFLIQNFINSESGFNHDINNKIYLQVGNYMTISRSFRVCQVDSLYK